MSRPKLAEFPLAISVSPGRPTLLKVTEKGHGMGRIAQASGSQCSRSETLELKPCVNDILPSECPSPLV